MRRKKKECLGCEGRLPAMAVLATPYVPFQLDNPPRFDGQKALVRGTLFPGLEFPLWGTVNSEELSKSPTSELQILAFAVQELALYLDTHRDDIEALELYRSYQTHYHKAMMEYSKMYGPLNHMFPREGNYVWLDDPWPWEYCENKEA